MSHKANGFSLKVLAQKKTPHLPFRRNLMNLRMELWKYNVLADTGEHRFINSRGPSQFCVVFIFQEVRSKRGCWTGIILKRQKEEEGEQSRT